MKSLIRIDFGNGHSADALVVDREARAGSVVASLGLPSPKGVVVVIGGTAPIEPDVVEWLGDQLEKGVARTAIDEGLTLVDGATDAGILALLGRGFAGQRPSAPVIGVAPMARVTWPGRHQTAVHDVAPLEPHHTHFVLVGADRWGDETPLMLRIVAELARHAPVVVILASGGPIARQELLRLVEANQPIIVLAGSGRLADEVASTAGAEPKLKAALATGQIEVLPPRSGPAKLASRLRHSIRAWRTAS